MDRGPGGMIYLGNTYYGFAKYLLGVCQGYMDISIYLVLCIYVSSIYVFMYQGGASWDISEVR